MGSCHSDLKGEKQSESTTEPAPQPIRKVQTNFSTVDYDTGASTRRDTVYAPNEVIREDKPEEFPPVAELASGEPETIQNRNSATISPETRLTTDSTNNQNLRREPYRDIDNDNLNSPISPINNHTTIPAVATTTAFSSDIPTTHYNPTTAPEDMGLFSKKKSSLEQPAPGFLNGTSYGGTSTPARKDSYLNVFPAEEEDGVTTPGGGRRLFGFEHMTPDEKKQIFSSPPLLSSSSNH